MESTISNILKQQLLTKGATLVGFGELTELVTSQEDDMRYGVSVAVAMTPHIVKSIAEAPTNEYYHEYKRLNRLLDELVSDGAQFLKENGFKAIAQTTNVVEEYGNYRTLLPHKSVATRAGIGWIGKCALLVTKKYGSAIRISSIITNAPLDCSAPINDSQCGDCMICVNACPASAATGEKWDIATDRDVFFNPILCRQTARARAAIIGLEVTLCGKCIEVCPYTKQYIKSF